MRTLLAALLLACAPALAQDAPPEAPDQGEVPLEELPIVSGPDLLEFVEATWPPEALAQGLEATVVLLVELDETGAIVSLGVSQPAGNGFDEAALDAVGRMKFSPAMTEAGPVPVLFEMPYNFLLTPEEPVEEAPLPVNLDGDVVQMGTRAPVVGARVVVEGTELVGITDEAGRFEIRGVPVGAHTVRVLEPGHVTVDASIEIPPGQAVTWRFWMRAESYRENEAVGVYQIEKQEVTRRTITIDEVRRVPGTFGDPIKVIQTLPGAARSPFGTGFLVIRGANPEDSGVYIDGVRVPIIYHLTGTTSVISPELIQAVDYLPGGFGAQYGRSMGGVVDVKTRESFDETKIVWGTDILDTQLYFQGNLGKNKKHGLAIAARRSYIDAFIPLFTRNQDFTLSPRYWDYQVKWIPDRPGDEHLSLFFYGFDDVLQAGTKGDTTQGSDQDTQGDLRTQYASQRLVLQWRKPIGETLTFSLTPSMGVDYNDFGLGDEFRLKSFNGIGEIRAELAWAPHPAFTFVPGVDLIGGWYSFDFTSPFTFDQSDDPLAERDSINVDGLGTAWAPDAYLKVLIRPLQDRDRWLINPGIRVSSVIYTYGGSLFDFDAQASKWAQVDYDPRLATRFAVTDAFVLKASTGLYTQPPQPFESISFGTDVDLVFERSFSSSFGAEHQITQAIRWDVEGFYRWMDDLVVFNPDFEQYGDTNWINAGQGRAYGVEVMVRHAPVGRFFGWISYTLSKAERRDDPADDWYAFDFDQTHILSAQAGYNLPYDIDVSAQVQYVTGNPNSTYDAGVYDADWDAYNPFRVGAYNGERLPPFFQTSVRVDKLWTFKRWQLDTYVELLNAIRGVNPEFTVYNYDYSDYAYVRGLPFIPNVGIEAKFWP